MGEVTSGRICGMFCNLETAQHVSGESGANVQEDKVGQAGFVKDQEGFVPFWREEEKRAVKPGLV